MSMIIEVSIDPNKILLTLQIPIQIYLCIYIESFSWKTTSQKDQTSLIIGRQTSKWSYEMWSSMKVTLFIFSWHGFISESEQLTGFGLN